MNGIWLLSLPETLICNPKKVTSHHNIIRDKVLSFFKMTESLRKTYWQ